MTSCSAARRPACWSAARTRSPPPARHPLARALRLDKLSLAALEATLALYRDPERARAEIPVLAMLTADEATLAERARRLADGIGAGARGRRGRRRRSAAARCRCSSCPGRWWRSAGSPDELAARLRAADPPVVGRIQDGRLLLDPRTLGEEDVDVVAGAVRAALNG